MTPASIKPTPDTPTETVEERYRGLAAAWHQDTDYLSSMEEAESHPAYQAIIRLGPEVIPLLLRDLAASHTHWFAALQSIHLPRAEKMEAATSVSCEMRVWVLQQQVLM